MTTREEQGVEIRLGVDEALVLFAWLAAQDGGGDADAPSAEDVVLWKIEAQLEKVLQCPLDADYDSSVQQARRSVVKRAVG